MPSELFWLIFLLPVISFVLVVGLVKPLTGKYSPVGGYITIMCIAGSAVLAIWALAEVMGAPNHEIHVPDITWLTIGDFSIKLGIIMDSLTAVMLVVVTVVSLMVQIYSLGYMEHFVHHEGDTYTRYYAWMSCLLYTSPSPRD